jgi:predicted nucleic acid-binding protein
LLRLARASTTFAGAARYAAWKIERHTGLALEITPFRERHPLLAAPQVLWALWRHRRAPRR